ncbi:hypothetical protein AOLI_G00006780 [Acnodon oligacanthus]
MLSQKGSPKGQLNKKSMVNPLFYAQPKRCGTSKVESHKCLSQFTAGDLRARLTARCHDIIIIDPGWRRSSN